jgi:hypothetical protein
LLRDVAGALQRCARWHGCPQLRILRSELEEFGERLGVLLGMGVDRAAA